MPWHRSAILAYAHHGTAATLETLRAQLTSSPHAMAPETSIHSVTTRGRHMHTTPRSTSALTWVPNPLCPCTRQPTVRITLEQTQLH
ncbi:hypothetical protein COCSADRAFT_40815 [Bipolaris sorokiniana ND90Pr]|uniref:Uncharacterized protein n=1 Tax=Cochliobolus sativus (strain ND90Pr / ATCC 201652) TaxID=665912 RepID=M2SRE1_COCSN|nr:uncharacterized protein COCSADRAFT_40815 [Bipolaris sorokiniana ND90Pr]EMD59646.1 hypothetical protein COCSADRAFT_40815 [Bipolaris sorokiniana ND90Pr]